MTDTRVEALLRAGRAVIRAADDYADDGPYLRADMKGAALDAALAQLRAALAGPLPEPASELSTRDVVARGFVRTALQMEGDDLESQGLSTVFDIATDTGRDRLFEMLERIGWVR